MTDRDMCVLKALAQYYCLNRPQLQKLCFPNDKTGRITRRRLQALVSKQLINRHRAEVVYPQTVQAGSIYYPAKQGCQLLAEIEADDRHLLTPTQCPQPHHIMHWLAVSQTHILLNGAIRLQNSVSVGSWTNEWDIINKDEADPAKRFKLYTVLQEAPKLICAPDAAFILSYQGYSKVFYLEQDRATTGAKQVAARKVKGYAAMQQQNFHRQQFPKANVSSLTVLCITPTSGRRDALRRAFQNKPGNELWKFASAKELVETAFLHEALFIQ